MSNMCDKFSCDNLANIRAEIQLKIDLCVLSHFPFFQDYTTIIISLFPKRSTHGFLLDQFVMYSNHLCSKKVNERFQEKIDKLQCHRFKKKSFSTGVFGHNDVGLVIYCN